MQKNGAVTKRPRLFQALPESGSKGGQIGRIFSNWAIFSPWTILLDIWDSFSRQE
jgi:hypothetical protein